MKVLLVNGSPHDKGSTYTALEEISRTLGEEGVDSEIFQLGLDPLSGCIDCKKCATLGNCVFNDKVNEFLEMAPFAEGFIFGSPVHYGSCSGSMTSFMDRVFFSDFISGTNQFIHKPTAAVVAARRAGTTAAFDQLNKYFHLAQMPVVTSQYWNMVHGASSQEVADDQEGLQTMRVLARNMAWLLKCIEAGKQSGVAKPAREERIFTNFVR